MDYNSQHFQWMKNLYEIPHGKHGPMPRKNQWLVANEPVEVQDFKKFSDHLRGIYRMYLK